MNKPVYWITLDQWSRMTQEEHAALDRHCERNGLEIGIDVAGWHNDQILAQEAEKDREEDRQTGGGPGA